MLGIREGMRVRVSEGQRKEFAQTGTVAGYAGEGMWLVALDSDSELVQPFRSYHLMPITTVQKGDES
jgi:hypothetical protein